MGQHWRYAFARMVAKIGYSAAVAKGQLKHVEGEPFPLAAILGQSDDIGRWVGTLTHPPMGMGDSPQLEIQEDEVALHRVAIHQDEKNGLLIAEVQLFSNSPTPSYGILLGRLRKRL